MGRIFRKPRGRRINYDSVGAKSLRFIDRQLSIEIDECRRRYSFTFNSQELQEIDRLYAELNQVRKRLYAK